MRLIKSPRFIQEFHAQLEFIARDKPSAAMDFEHEIDRRIAELPRTALGHRMNKTLRNAAYREIIYRGYVVLFRIVPVGARSITAALAQPADGDAIEVLSIYSHNLLRLSSEWED